jgi:hypothetical protein
MESLTLLKTDLKHVTVGPNGNPDAHTCHGTSHLAGGGGGPGSEGLRSTLYALKAHVVCSASWTMVPWLSCHVEWQERQRGITPGGYCLSLMVRALTL